MLERIEPITEARYWAKVQLAGPDACWIWFGATDGGGYGQIKLPGIRTPAKAHRVAYLIAHGHPVPEGLTIDHLCRTPPCVNPAHLEAVTMRENILRSTGPSALHSQQTHCVHGHEFTVENTYFYTKKDGSQRRYCRACTALRKAEPAYKEQQRLAWHVREGRRSAS